MLAHAALQPGRAARNFGPIRRGKRHFGLGTALHERKRRVSRHSVAWYSPATRSRHAHGKGYRRLLLGHTANRAVALRETLGVRVVLVDAENEHAAAFHAAFGFRRRARTQ